jgi:chemosensory pili system protein ChpA (sensor histidine kinase/response regulator)
MKESVELNSIKWVLKELEPLFEDIQSSLEKFSEDVSDLDKLGEALPILEQVLGTLTMIEQYGAALVVEEIILLVKGLINKTVKSPTDSLDVLMQVILQFPNYLTKLRAGSQGVPVILLPIINDIRAVRNEKLLSENVLFFPKIDEVSDHQNEAYSEDLATVAKKSRLQFLKALLSWYQEKDTVESI